MRELTQKFRRKFEAAASSVDCHGPDYLPATRIGSTRPVNDFEFRTQFSAEGWRASDSLPGR
ncbi:hypothetical protein [Rhizobium jaguaris]|uniref:hypothetical protein n=1 Tax=Rhizobium jaguaris TaxID=1312183 RepID=UPI0013C4FB27|nr:hypothetical protein [Rhizobium jaguaris]